MWFKYWPVAAVILPEISFSPPFCASDILDTLHFHLIFYIGLNNLCTFRPDGWKFVRTKMCKQRSKSGTDRRVKGLQSQKAPLQKVFASHVDISSCFPTTCEFMWQTCCHHPISPHSFTLVLLSTEGRCTSDNVSTRHLSALCLSDILGILRVTADSCWCVPRGMGGVLHRLQNPSRTIIPS